MSSNVTVSLEFSRERREQLGLLDEPDCSYVIVGATGILWMDRNYLERTEIPLNGEKRFGIWSGRAVFQSVG
jgi:hypothetical protein